MIGSIRIRPAIGLMPSATLLLAGCGTGIEQSALHPAGPAAAEIARVWWIMCGAFAAVFALVLLLLLAAMLTKRTDDRASDPGSTLPLGRTGFIVGGGLVLPILVLTPLYLLSLKTSAALSLPHDVFTVRVVGHRWWWEVRYPEQGIVTANEIHIPAGQPVRLELTSADVIHSFWAPRLNGKRDLIPGVEGVFWIEADAPGVYRGQCAEYCGTQHANMAFEVVALAPGDFASWISERALPRRGAPRDEPRGLQIFLRAGCSQCHAVAGTLAIGNTGPDLTHIGSRRTIAAATRLNTRENLAAWIADPHTIKPGVRMPGADLPGDDLSALVEFLEGLK